MSSRKIKFYPFNEETAMFTPPPVPASKMVPEWYKRQPATVDEERGLASGSFNGTVKKCIPIFDLMTAGYILSLPMDVYIDASDPNKLNIQCPNPMKRFGTDMFATHSPEQYNHYPVDTDLYHKQLFRIMPFWAFKTEKGYSTLILHPNHQDDLPFKALGGFVDTDKFITDGHFSFFIKKGFVGVIKQGTPLVQIIPMKRDDWESEIVSHEQVKKEIGHQRIFLRSTFSNGYKNKYRSMKRFK